MDGASTHLLCPSCDHEPPSSSAVGDVCPACGAKLVFVKRQDELIGTIVDRRFEVRSVLGSGGMGTVYLAWQQSIGREIALKVLDRSFSHDVGMTKRFLREARLASSLSHPNTVSIIDFGQAEDGRLFIAMELLRGMTLARVLHDGGALTFERVARIGIQLFDTLATAHKQQIIHRDLKLENIMRIDDARGDHIKVLDFGLAKSLIERDPSDTQAGTIMGTPQYIAPEAMTGVQPSATNDLYAAGVVLGELITGRDLWEPGDIHQLLNRKLTEKPELTAAPRALRELILRLVDPHPTKRPDSAAAVSDELQRMLETARTPGAVQISFRGQPTTISPSIASVQERPDSVAVLTVADLTDLDERDGARPKRGTKPPLPPEQAMLFRKDADLPELELEKEWHDRRRPSAAPPNQPLAQRSAAPARRSRLPLIAVIIVLLAGAAIAAYILRRHS